MANSENKIKQPWENQPCPLCRASKSGKRCPGHRAGSGSGSGKTSAPGGLLETKEVTKASRSVLSNELHSPILDPENKFSADASWSVLSNKNNSPTLYSENKFNAEVLLKLLLEGKLLIGNNAAHNTFSIKLNCAPGSLSTQQKIEVNNFLNAIVDELHAFEAKHNIASQFKFETDQDGNILSFSIKMPTKKTHDAFMQQLLSKNLVLQNTPHITNQAKEDSAENKKTNHRRTPFSKVLLPPGYKK